jgi:autotransporter-associated beta strand protein
LGTPRDDYYVPYTPWTFTTVRDWGESSLGTWKLEVRDGLTGDVGTFNDWTITFDGAAIGLSHWASGVGGSWKNPNMWATNWVPNGAGQQAALDASSTASMTVTLDAPQTIGQLTLTNTAGNSLGYTITAGSAGTLTFDNSGSISQLNVTSGSHAISAPVILAGNLAVTVSGGSTLDISGSISETGGSQSLTLDGPGTLQLAGTNSFTGGTVVSGGTLELVGAESLLAGSSLAIGSNASSGAIFTAPSSNAAQLSPVPEPSTLVLLVIGVSGMLAMYHKHRLQLNRGTTGIGQCDHGRGLASSGLAVIGRRPGLRWIGSARRVRRNGLLYRS